MKKQYDNPLIVINLLNKNDILCASSEQNVDDIAQDLFIP